MHPITTKIVENTGRTSLTSNKHGSKLTGLQEIITQRNYVKILHTEFQPHRYTNMESTGRNSCKKSAFSLGLFA